MSKGMVIAGEFSGRKVECVPALKESYRGLLSAANRGNHWARLAVKELQSLTTGRVGKPNVFVRSTGAINTKVGNEEFYIFLPGIRATGEALPNGRYKIVNMVLDPGYFKATAVSQPGMYKVAKSGAEWEASYSNDGSISREKNRVVAITDARYETAKIAADSVAEKVVQAPGSPKKGRIFDSVGFDMHYSSLSSPYGGMRRYGALEEQGSYGSAKLLAKAMFDAKDIEGVNWVSERGGSVVLTQAMKLLDDAGVKLNKHAAFMVLPTSSPKKAIELGHRLGLVRDEEFVKTGFMDTAATLSSISSIPSRIKDVNDPYGVANGVKEVGSSVCTHCAGLSVITGVTLMAGSAMTLTAPAATAVIAAATVGASLTGLASLAQNSISWGQSLIEKHKK